MSDDKIPIRFYPPVPLKCVSLCAQLPSINQEILLAYCDSIPAFSDIEYAMPTYNFEREYDTSVNTRICLPNQHLEELKSENVTIRIESNDELWQKRSSFKPKWEIAFNSFVGILDLVNGGPA